MQVAEPEMMGVVDDDRIHIRDRIPALYDIRTPQHVIFLIYKVQYPFPQFMPPHLAMRITDAQVRAKPLDDGRHLPQPLYPVIDEEDLPAPLRLEIDGVPD